MKPAHLSTFTNISLAKLYDSVSESTDAKQLIVIPKYQRGIVWKDKQKRALLDSIYKGFPIGALLCHDTRDHVEINGKRREKWDLVDGLQRTSTLRQFIEKPLVLLPLEQTVSEGIFSKTLRKLDLPETDSTKSHLWSALNSWCTDVEVTKAAKGFNSQELKKSILKEFPECQMSDDIDATLNQLIDEIGEAIEDILTIEIPVIVYSGQSSEVPTIFQLVNSMGTQLTKYQVFAATWSKYATRVNNPKIQEKIKQKYKTYIDRGFEVQGFDETEQIGESEYNLYEYLYGLGQHLASNPKFGRLFPDPEQDNDDAAAVAFNMATVAFGLRINEMHKLAGVLAEHESNGRPINLEAFERAIENACLEVWTALEPYLGLRLNSVDADARITSHSVNQIISLIVRYLVAAYEPITWEKKHSSEQSSLLENIPKYYLFDIIGANWRSAGEKRLWDMVWNSETSALHRVFVPSTDYLEPISRDKWSSLLKVWFEDQLAKKQTSRPNLTEATRVFLKFLYSHILTFHVNSSVTFHIEHLYPVKVLSDAINATSPVEGWPISHVGNLCLLPQEINEKKGEMMLGDFLAKPDIELSMSQARHLNNYVITPEPSELTMPNEFGKSDYLEFCRERFNKQTELLLGFVAPGIQ